MFLIKESIGLFVTVIQTSNETLIKNLKLKKWLCKEAIILAPIHYLSHKLPLQISSNFTLLGGDMSIGPVKI